MKTNILVARHARQSGADNRKVNSELENGNIISSSKKGQTLSSTPFSRLKGKIYAGERLTLVASTNCGKSTFSMQIVHDILGT